MLYRELKQNHRTHYERVDMIKPLLRQEVNKPKIFP